MEGDVITLQDIYLFDYGMGIDAESGRALGHLKPTGIRPKITEHLQDQGIAVDADWFDPEEFARAAAKRVR